MHAQWILYVVFGYNLKPLTWFKQIRIIPKICANLNTLLDTQIFELCALHCVTTGLQYGNIETMCNMICFAAVLSEVKKFLMFLNMRFLHWRNYLMILKKRFLWSLRYSSLYISNFKRIIHRMIWVCIYTVCTRLVYYVHQSFVYSCWLDKSPLRSMGHVTHRQPTQPRWIRLKPADLFHLFC